MYHDSQTGSITQVNKHIVKLCIILNTCCYLFGRYVGYILKPSSVCDDTNDDYGEDDEVDDYIVTWHTL